MHFRVYQPDRHLVDVKAYVCRAMAVLDNRTTVIDASYLEGVTFPWEEPNAKTQRRNVYYTLHGIIGLLSICSNGFVLYAYAKRAKVRKNISFMMLNVLITCFIHGWIVGLVYPLQEVYRAALPDSICIIITMIMDYADRYTLLVLPALAAERFWFLKHPFLRRENTKRVVIVSTILLLLLTALSTMISWLPLIPNLASPTMFIESTKRQQELTEFYRADTCNFMINKKSNLEPYFMLAMSAFSVVVVMALYTWMLFIVRDRLYQHSSMSKRLKYNQVRRAAIAVALVNLTFIITLLPYRIIFPVKELCDADVTFKQYSLCISLTTELKFVFSVIAHIGYVLAPLIFPLVHARKIFECSLTDRRPNGSVKSMVIKDVSYIKSHDSCETSPTKLQQTIFLGVWVPTPTEYNTN